MHHLINKITAYRLFAVFSCRKASTERAIRWESKILGRCETCRGFHPFPYCQTTPNLKKAGFRKQLILQHLHRGTQLQLTCGAPSDISTSGQLGTSRSETGE